MKYALVTGGSRGIGKAVSIKLAEMGYKVVINYASNEEQANNTLAAIRELGGDGELLKFDVSNTEECAEVLAKWQEEHPDEYIEVLVNNAGIRRDNLPTRLCWKPSPMWALTSPNAATSSTPTSSLAVCARELSSPLPSPAVLRS